MGKWKDAFSVEITILLKMFLFRYLPLLHAIIKIINKLYKAHLYNEQIQLQDDHFGTGFQGFHERENIPLAPRYEPTTFR